MSKQLWSLRFINGNTTLPVLQRDNFPVNANGNINQDIIKDVQLSNLNVYGSRQTSTHDYIDVVNNFPWTRNPQSARNDVPALLMVEKRILVNSLISNIANSVFAMGDVASTITPAAIQQAISSGASSLLNAGKELANKTGVLDNVVVKSVAGVLQNAKTISDANKFTNPALEPYNNLYLLEKTGFIYKLPYFDNALASSTTSFGNDSPGILTGISEVAAQISNTAANYVSFVKPGVFIERSKQFSMEDKGRALNVKFPLLNTGAFSDISLNWQLLFGLIYQNKPGRVTRSIIDMPVLYEVQLPGIAYMPYAYISNLAINFLGSRRLMTIDIPQVNGNGFVKLETIIPDAYEVSLTIQGLNNDTRNFMYASLTNNVVTTS